ncbi:MAG: hypothetical protein HQ402_00960 [Parcubacteria group bacterium]|nr:hypothetical protein [Parcubacteria group bacterium]
MKKKNNKKESKPLKKETAGEKFSLTEIATLIDQSQESLARMMSDGFVELHREIKGVDQRLILTREELLRKLSSTDVRIDDLAHSRVSHVEYKNLLTKVGDIEQKLSPKNKK